MLMKPSAEVIERLVQMALLEDAPWGDLTSDALIPTSTRITAQLVAREEGVLSGADVFSMTMSLANREIITQFRFADGERFSAGNTLAVVEGPAQGILRAERVALNFVQRMCGIATLTAKYVAKTAGTKARIVDTRKTTPGLRVLERYAVRCGGGQNHRFSLSDALLAKDNHLAILAADGRQSIREALMSARAAVPHTIRMEVEVDRLDEIEAVLVAGVDTIMFDNFTVQDLRRGVEHVSGRALVEASGGITLDRIGEVASTGVDIISVGALTHSVRSLDLGLDIQPPHIA
jgi:nicotinate-nucleotide pyrophosphorylase (carboxylating)